MKRQNIIIFDSHCSFCNACVQFVLKKDRESQFMFADIESKTAQKFFKQHKIKNKEVLRLFLTDSTYCCKSTAALNIAKRLSAPWSIFWLGVIIPVFIRDKIYDFISCYRGEFTKNKMCKIFSKKYQSRFLK